MGPELYTMLQKAGGSFVCEIHRFDNCGITVVDLWSVMCFEFFRINGEFKIHTHQLFKNK